MSNDTSWRVKEFKSLTEFNPNELLPALASNDVAAVQISNFYSSKELTSIVKNILSQGILWYPRFEHKQGRIGICATEYHAKLNGKAAYFALEPEHTHIRKGIFSEVQDPIVKLIDLFSRDYETAIACEPAVNNLEYFSGIIRAMQSKSTVHFDYAPHQLSGWWASSVEAQFSIVIYLQMPESGGELTIYNRQWVVEDDKYDKDTHEKGPRGFDASFLENVNSTVITPHPGDIIIFNTRNFHQVEAIESEQPRLTCNSFIGLKDNKLYLWS